jgi:GNAT superfamily N-acetyltransferase
MTRAEDEIETAIEAFVRGFCATKSQTHPYEHTRIGKLWMMRDAPRRNPRNYRKEEWIAYHVRPDEVDRVARQQTRGRFFVCSISGMDESDEPIRAAYKQLGYRLLSSEPLFIHRLARIPRLAAPAEIEHVRTSELAERFGKASRSRPIPADLLADHAPFRQYVAHDDGEIVGWVRSVDAGDSTWCSNMYVRPAHRRRGIGKAMLAKMLRDDRKLGKKWSVLLSSHAGAMLYPHVGYEQIGLLLIWAPKKASRAG